MATTILMKRHFKMKYICPLIIASFSLSSVVLSSCSKPHKYTISNLIDENTRDEVLNISAPKLEIEISSPGGKVGPSIEVAEFLMGKTVTFNVRDYCNSACPQILLPVADNINFIDEPLIGFHWSLGLDVDQYIKNGGDVTSCTTLMELYERKKKILNYNHLNENFWKDVSFWIKPYNFKFTTYPNDKCKGYDYDIENFMWYPDSQQLSELYGLDFKGKVCADNFIECGKRIDQLSPLGVKAKIVIGDKVFVSNGQAKK